MALERSRFSEKNAQQNSTVKTVHQFKSTFVLVSLQHWPCVREGCRRNGECFNADLGSASSRSLAVRSVGPIESVSLSLPGSSSWTEIAPSSSEACRPPSDEEFSFNKKKNSVKWCTLQEFWQHTTLCRHSKRQPRVTIVNSQLVCLPPAGILNLHCGNVYLSLFVYIGPEKPRWGVANYVYIFFHENFAINNLQLSANRGFLSSIWLKDWK